MRVRNGQVKVITAALLATGDYTAATHDLDYRLHDAFVATVTRLRYTGSLQHEFLTLSLWSETEYQLSVDGATVAVPDLIPLNCVLAESRYDPAKPGIAASLPSRGAPRRASLCFPACMHSARRRQKCLRHPRHRYHHFMSMRFMF